MIGSIDSSVMKTKHYAKQCKNDAGIMAKNMNEVYLSGFNEEY